MLLEDFNERKLMKPDISDIQMDKEFYLVSYGLKSCKSIRVS